MLTAATLCSGSLEGWEGGANIGEGQVLGNRTTLSLMD